jgi:DNA polymerase III beta subunit, C-terminal domain
VTFAGTDGHVLYKFDHHHGVPFIKEGTEQLIPLPASVANSIDIIFGNSNEINVSADSSTMKLSSANATLAVRMCEQRYPNYNSVIRKESPYHVTIPVRDLLQTIKRISVMASESSQIIRIQKEGEQLVLSAIDPDFSRASKESVAFTEANISEGFEIAFNHNNLSKLLTTISTDNVRLEFESSSASILLKEDAPNSALTEMCMPIVA